MGSSSLTRDQTAGPLHWQHGVLATTEPPRKSLQAVLICLHSRMCVGQQQKVGLERSRVALTRGWEWGDLGLFQVCPSSPSGCFWFEIVRQTWFPWGVLLATLCPLPSALACISPQKGLSDYQMNRDEWTNEPWVLLTCKTLTPISRLICLWGFPDGPVVKTVLPMQGAQVQFLVGELRFPRRVVQSKEILKKCQTNLSVFHPSRTLLEKSQII